VSLLVLISLMNRHTKRTERAKTLARFLVYRELSANLTVNIHELAWVVRALCPDLESKDAIKVVFSATLAVGGCIYWDNPREVAERMQEMLQPKR
jgi:hypothetical protein